jgi:nitrogen-specific signal transduction histidine kinase
VAFGPALVEAFAHRVRSCITAIGAAGDYMLEANLPPEKQREMLYIIEDEVAAIADLLSDFLVVAGKSAVGDVGPLTSVDLSSVTKRMVHRLASNAQSMGAWLAADASEPCPPVLGDEHLLQQAVLSALRSVLRLARAGDRVVASSLRPGPAQSGRGPQVELTISVEPKDGEGTAGAARRAGKPDLQLGDLPLVSVRMIAEQHGGEVSSLTDRVGISLTLPGAPLHTRPQAGALAYGGG